MNTTRVWYIVSDVHLGTRRADPRCVRNAFARFVDDLATRAALGDRHLVLLGDLFDFDSEPHDPVARLVNLADRNRQVFRALGAAIDSGIRIHVVCGNHDLELASPEVWDTWIRLLGVPSTSTGVQLHPWFLHVPGVVYAEHGHQHHEVSRSPTMLDHCSPGMSGAVPNPPLRDWIDAAGKGFGYRLIALTASLGRARSAEKRASSPDFTAQLALQASREKLPLHVVQELVKVSRFRVHSAALNIARRRVARRLGFRSGDVLCAAAARVSKTLLAGGRHAPVVVFGHTHRAGLVALDPESTYANCGTWTNDIRGPGPDQKDPGLFPVVVLSTQPQRVNVVIDYWDAARETWQHQQLVPEGATSQQRRSP